jgi:S1-C subfamily serine protease
MGAGSRRYDGSVMDKQADRVAGRGISGGGVALASCVLLLCSTRPVNAQVAPDPLPPKPQTQTSQVQGPDEYLDTREGPIELSQLGIQVRDDRAKLKDGRAVRGVAVVDVSPNGAGTKAFEAHRTSRYIMGGALIVTAAALFFPPLIVPVLILACSGVGQSFDLIIGVDGNRVCNTFELVQAVQDTQAGDMVYLAVVREGRRIQIAVRVN